MPTLPDPFHGLPARLAGLAKLAARVSGAAAAAERYRFGAMSGAECRLLYEMLRAVGADGRDAVMAALTAHMATAERSRARGRSVLRRRRAGEG